MKVKKLFCIIPGIKKINCDFIKAFNRCGKPRKIGRKKFLKWYLLGLQAQIEKQKLNSNKVHKMPFLYILCKKINSVKCSYETAN